MSITFGDICSLLQSIENITSQRPRSQPKQENESLRQIIRNWFLNQREALDNQTTDGGAVLSALLPHRRKDRVYGLGPPRLAKRLIKILGLNRFQKATFDGWRSGALGDLGAYTERALRSRDGTFRSKHTIPIERIDQLLVQLAAKSRFSDKSTRNQGNGQTNSNIELKDIIVRLESWEAKWLVRLILRDYCTIDLDEYYILRQYHFLLPDLLKFQNDFETVCGMLHGELSCYEANPSHSQEREMRIQAAKRLYAVPGIKVGRPTFHKAWSLQNCFRMVGNRVWAAEVKYDGEYCEIHVDLEACTGPIKIFSKNGKDSTEDRKALHGTIREALRIGRPDCRFKKQCIVLAEMVLYSDREKKILPFSKIRKHISRSGSFLGTLQDSPPHQWEHLMVVFFDLLKVDNEEVLRQCLQNRRKMLRDLVCVTPGRSMRSEWTLLDFRTADGITDLKQAFARSLASHQEGLVLKPLDAPYFSLLSEQGRIGASFFIKLKKDYLSDMGGERDLGDFAVIGASFDAQTAPKSSLKPLHWTHFHLGCCKNLREVQLSHTRPKFKVVATLSFEKCIPKSDFKFLNIQGYVRQSPLREHGSSKEFDIEQSNGVDQRMTIAFKQPFVVEILGGGFEKLHNETFEMLRHPRIEKIHQDRTWEDAVTVEALERMAEEKWEAPNADTLDGHAKDVAILVRKYLTQEHSSQVTMTTEGTIQTTQQTITPSEQEKCQDIASGAVVLETQQYTHTTTSTSQWSADGSTQGIGTTASREVRLSLCQNTSECINTIAAPAERLSTTNTTVSTSAVISMKNSQTSSSKHNFAGIISPPNSKRRKILNPLCESENNRCSSLSGSQSHGKMLHSFAKEENVKLHASEEDNKAFTSFISPCNISIF